MEQQSARSLTTVGVRVGSFSLWPRSAASAAIVFALALVTYGNVYSALPANVREPYDWLFITLGFVLILPATLWVATQGISYSDIGLRTTRPYKELLVGLAVGAVVILPVVVYFLFPWGLPGGDIDYEGSKESTLGSFMVWAFLRQPLGTSIFEEVMFRGILLALSMRAFGLMRGVIFAAVAFAAWHLVVNFYTVQETNAGTDLAVTVVAQVASMLGLMAGALFLSLLRLKTGGLLAPISFHWVVVVAMQGTLFMLA